ncbi:hypothetical protein F7734_13755 [Scytonema sp. UIC 10036]|uniref:hypothetical protein n=1 Tax=Scytonema sp. UIC 10036 TaxID=2304196 RepID=UPI0012DA0EAA|nr:hypothetical protein [Scytonema sp. UIC 10036]MUG93437.1 hypothetical protein [Scytonema sp. UIC 10036]
MKAVSDRSNLLAKFIIAILAELARRQLQTENNLQRTQEQIERTQEQIERTQLQIDATQ